MPDVWVNTFFKSPKPKYRYYKWQYCTTSAPYTISSLQIHPRTRKEHHFPAGLLWVVALERVAYGGVAAQGLAIWAVHQHFIETS